LLRFSLQSGAYEHESCACCRDPGEKCGLEGHESSRIIWEGEPDAQSIARLQAMGISSLVFDPVANVPQQGDFMTIMKKNLSEIAKAYRLK